MTKRIEYIDIMKAIGILLMVLLHTIDLYPKAFEYISSFHMAIFFIITGLFGRREQSFRESLSKGFVQLMLPYFIFSFFSLLYGWNYPLRHPELYYTDGSFSDIFSKQLIGIFLMCDRITSYSFLPCEPLWFLPCLFMCRIFFSLWFIKKGQNKMSKYMTKILVFVLLYSFYKLNISLFTLNSTALVFPFFLFGFYLKKYFLRDFKNVNKIFFFILLLISSYFVYLLEGHYILPGASVITGNIILAYIRAILGVCVVFCSALLIQSVNFRIIKKEMTSIGEATLTILGFHFLIIAIFKVIGVKLFDQSLDFNLTLGLIMTILCVIILTLIHHKFLITHFPLAVGKGNLNHFSKSEIIGKLSSK